MKVLWKSLNVWHSKILMILYSNLKQLECEQLQFKTWKHYLSTVSFFCRRNSRLILSWIQKPSFKTWGSSRIIRIRRLQQKDFFNSVIQKRKQKRDDSEWQVNGCPCKMHDNQVEDCEKQWDNVLGKTAKNKLLN